MNQANPADFPELRTLPHDWRGIWDTPEWQSLPYHSVQIAFSEGTIVHVPAEWLVTHAAFYLQQGDLSWKVYMDQQVLPAVLGNPEYLIDYAKTLGWPILSMLLLKSFFKSPAILLHEQFEFAHITLSPFTFPEAR